MKKIIFIISAFTLFAGISAAQNWQSKEAAALICEDNTRAGNNTNSYEFGKIVDTPASKGYKPVSGPYYDWNTVKANKTGYLR